MLAGWREARSAFPTPSKSLESSSAWGAGALLLQAAVANCCSARGNCCPDLPSDGNGIAATLETVETRATKSLLPMPLEFLAKTLLQQGINY
ncbi:hypothetical protein PR003_g18445 [Phytophthora rubi]|uniref:Uncharacterized protein n=1 Tax=Phytophthora rubi TaxID=129364 RepID=A0A6A4EE65_9STRA|nr:hypothetical protein PR001_g17554 [Phytophthora rubi]KAE9317582.1 hypothetical protein PR003_g18445 [Phytophthora rubi]